MGLEEIQVVIHIHSNIMSIAYIRHSIMHLFLDVFRRWNAQLLHLGVNLCQFRFRLCAGNQLNS
jgi:hypothetical protein